MSILYCPYHHQYIDTDYEEHFDENEECIEEKEDSNIIK